MELFAVQKKSVALDILLVVALVVGAFLLHLLGAVNLEFFRHTEADRTLIGWEMLRRGDFLVPRLLDSVILTKPPLFYWLIAAAIHLTGDASELTARLPTLIAAASLTGAHYVFWRAVGASQKTSAFAACVLSVSPMFFRLASVAEIDMLFGFWCSLAFYCAYVGLTKPYKRWLIVAYLFAALAFLTKGPPIVPLFGLPVLVFYFWQCYIDKDNTAGERLGVPQFIIANFIGGLVFLALVGAWLSALATEIGWSALATEFQVEILNRVTEPFGRNKGPFFYFKPLIVGLLPWSLLALIGFILPAIKRSSIRYKDLFQMQRYNSFLVFHGLVLACAFILLTISFGKSSRYIFPVFSATASLAALGVLQLRGQQLAWLFRGGQALGALLIAAAVLGPMAQMFSSLEGVKFIYLAASCGALLISGGVLLLAARRCSSRAALMSLLAVLVSVRIGQALIYTPYRNVTRSVTELAFNIENSIPEGVDVYTLEMFERWVVYYMIRDGRNVKRLTQKHIDRLALDDGDTWLLLSNEHERWRIAQLELTGEPVQLVEELTGGEQHLMIVRVNNKALLKLDPQKRFPTNASPVKLPAEIRNRSRSGRLRATEGGAKRQASVAVCGDANIVSLEHSTIRWNTKGLPVLYLNIVPY